MIDVSVSIAGILMCCDESLYDVNLGRGYTIEKCDFEDLPFKESITDEKGYLDTDYFGSRIFKQGKMYFVCIKKEEIPGELCCFESIDSTNEEAKRRGEAGAPDGSIYVADNQTNGKGRRGRTWLSPSGEDIFFTILLRPDLPLNSVSMLTLVAASAVAEAVDEVTGQECQIKWPNDIVLNKKKVCGILTEMNMEIDSIAYVVVGIGINVNRINFGEEIADMATSLKKESGHNIERSVLLSEILTAFFRDYKLFLEKQDLSPFLDYYNRKLVNVDHEVKIIKKDEEIIRTAIGINERGELIVQDAEGRKEYIFSGEVSVRGIYGYV